MGLSGILIGAGLCAFSTFLILQRWQWRNLARRSETWLVTEGTVMSSNIEQRNCDVAELFEPCITYRYIVDGRAFSGSSISFALPTFSIPRARQIVERYRPGTSMPIRYDPFNPKHAILERAKPLPPIGSLELSTALLGLGVLIYELNYAGFGSLFL